MNKLTRDEILLYVIVSCIVTAIVSVGIGYLLRKRIAEARIGSAEEKADSIMKEAEKSRESALREAETLKKETSADYSFYNLKDALEKSKELAEKDDTILIFGSLYLVGEILKLIK